MFGGCVCARVRVFDDEVRIRMMSAFRVLDCGSLVSAAVEIFSNSATQVFCSDLGWPVSHSFRHLVL